MRKIIAVGGGGLGSAADPAGMPPLLLGELALNRPRIGFLPTASGDSLDYIEGFRLHGERYGYEPVVVSLFRLEQWQPELEGVLHSCDAIYVGGGNTRNMLHLWRLWGIDQVLRGAYEAGIPLMGVSAGAICWFEQGNTDSFGPGLVVMPGLGWLAGSCTPHLDEESERRPTLQRQLATEEIGSGWGLRRGAGLVFEDERAVRRLLGTEDAEVFRCSAAGFEPATDLSATRE
jgi:dipeptidase E